MDNMSDWHASLLAAPWVLLKVCGGHCVQVSGLFAPKNSLYVPGGQSSHLAARLPVPWTAKRAQVRRLQANDALLSKRDRACRSERVATLDIRCTG